MMQILLYDPGKTSYYQMERNKFGIESCQIFNTSLIGSLLIDFLILSENQLTPWLLQWKCIGDLL